MQTEIFVFLLPPPLGEASNCELGIQHEPAEALLLLQSVDIDLVAQLGAETTTTDLTEKRREQRAVTSTTSIRAYHVVVVVVVIVTVVDGVWRREQEEEEDTHPNPPTRPKGHLCASGRQRPTCVRRNGAG